MTQDRFIQEVGRLVHWIKVKPHGRKNMNAKHTFVFALVIVMLSILIGTVLAVTDDSNNPQSFDSDNDYYWIIGDFESSSRPFGNIPNGVNVAEYSIGDNLLNFPGGLYNALSGRSCRVVKINFDAELPEETYLVIKWEPYTTVSEQQFAVSLDGEKIGRSQSKRHSSRNRAEPVFEKFVLPKTTGDNHVITISLETKGKIYFDAIGLYEKDAKMPFKPKKSLSSILMTFFHICQIVFVGYAILRIKHSRYVTIDSKEIKAGKGYWLAVFMILLILLIIPFISLALVVIFPLFRGTIGDMLFILIYISFTFIAIMLFISPDSRDISYCGSCDEPFDFDVTVCPLCGNELEHDFKTGIKMIRDKMNGKIFVSYITGDEHGKLDIENGTDLDAVAILTPLSTNEILLAVYIRANDSNTVWRISDGEYSLYFTLGKNWDDELKEFRRNQIYQRFEDPINFISIRSSEGSIKYNILSVTLHEVAEGRANTIFVDEDEFPTW